MIALYLHLPFCARICSYCDFAVLKAPRRVQELYVQTLLQEARLRIPPLQLERWYTIYFGGGTPSALAFDLWPTLLQGLHQLLPLQPQVPEFSVECNPESTTLPWVQLMRDWGVNRFSLGVQSLDAQILQRLQRNHDPQQAHRALDLLCAQGVRVNADLMFDLPGQSPAQFHGDLQAVVNHGVQHVSFYGLQIEPQTLLGQQVRKKLWRENSAPYGEFYAGGGALLQKLGLERYEISNFAVPGQESAHNRHYWHRGAYLGLGPGAHSFLDGVRSGAPSSFPRWVSWVQQGCPAAGMEIDVLDAAAARLEQLWLGLRQSTGIPWELCRSWGWDTSQPRLQKYLRRGWLCQNDRFLYVLRDGWVFLDDIIADLASILE